MAYSVAGHSTKSSWYSAMEYAKKSNSFSSHSEDADVSEKLLSATPFVQVATERCKQGNTIQYKPCSRNNSGNKAKWPATARRKWAFA